MSRDRAIDAAAEQVRSGAFQARLGRLVAHRTESQLSGQQAALLGYLTGQMQPWLEELGFTCRTVESDGQFLIAARDEGTGLPTVLIYGHGDTVPGMAGHWRDGLDPFAVSRQGDRLYGRGTADNKGQHAINIAALGEVLRQRGRLGFNVRIIVEMGEETGSPGLRTVCEAERETLRADLLLASDGPRLDAGRPTIFLGARGGLRLHLDVDLRAGSHHSGNWGGLIANPATILANAIACLVDGRGRILLDALKPPEMPPEVREALQGSDPTPGAGEPSLSAGWGEPGLSAGERVYGWNTLEVLAFGAGDMAAPQNAIPGRAAAVLQLRFVVGTRIGQAAQAVRAHLDAQGFGMVAVTARQSFPATRTDLANPWVGWARDSIAATVGSPPAVLPNFGGSLPNDVFADLLGLPTLWIPHSYPGCSQHAPDEHLLVSVAEQGMRIMAGLFWDLAEDGPRLRRQAGAPGVAPAER